MKRVLLFAILILLNCTTNKFLINNEGPPLELYHNSDVFIMPPPFGDELVDPATGGHVHFEGLYPEGKIEGTLHLPAGFTEEPKYVRFGLSNPLRAVFEISPMGFIPEIPAIAEIKLPKELGLSAEDLVLYEKENDVWREIEFDVEDGEDALTLKFKVERFTLFALLGR